MNFQNLEKSINELYLNQTIDKDDKLAAQVTKIKGEITKITLDKAYSDQNGSKRLYIQLIDKIRLSPEVLEPKITSIMQIMATRK